MNISEARKLDCLIATKKYVGQHHTYTFMESSDNKYLHINDRVSNANSVLIRISEARKALGIENGVE